MIDRNVLDDAIRGWLAAESGHPVGLGRVPGSNPSPPYGVVWPAPSPAGEGSWANPQEDGCFWYDVHSVGVTVEQSQYLADKVYKIFLSRDSGGDYTHPLVVAVPGHPVSIHWRADVARQGTTKSGDTLYDTIDRYEVRAS